MGRCLRARFRSLSVDGTIDLETHDRRALRGPAGAGQRELDAEPVQGSIPTARGATRVPVKVGRASVNEIQVLEGLKEGDTVILSDMSRYDNVDRIRLE